MNARFALTACAVVFGMTAFAVPSYADHSDFSLFVNIPSLFAPPPPQRVVVVAPPPPPAYVVGPPPPQPGFVWIQGFWDWDGRRYVWREGHWDHDRPGFVYAPARWVQVGGGWHLTPGRWQRRDDDHPHGCPPGLAMQGRC